MSSAPNDDETTAPWADLLPEVCDNVLDRLDAVSVIRFPAACISWAAASKTNPRLRSGTPALLTSGLDPEGYDTEHDVEAGAFGLHDISTGKSYAGEAQGLKARTWVGGKDDWLVTTDLNCGVELLNPITGDRVPLPSFTAIQGVRAQGLSDYGDLHIAISNRWYHFQQVTLCQTPAHPNGFLAVALFYSGGLGLISFTAAGGDDSRRWTPLKNPEWVDYLLYTDVNFHDGKVVAVTEAGDIYSWDMDGAGAQPTWLPGPEVDIGDALMRGFYFATVGAGAGGGNLQVVCMFGHGANEDKRIGQRIVYKDQWCFFVRRVTLHELDAAAGEWRRVRDLGGDRALFVWGNYPFYVTVPPGGSKDLQADCVHVADLVNCVAAVFDLKLEDDYEYEFERRLDYPAMGDSLQNPMWYRPTAHPLA